MSDDLFMRSYDLRNDIYSSCFESPDNNKFDPTYHVISPQKPDRCYVSYRDGTVCEYNLKTGSILRRITVNGYPDRLLLSQKYNKLYIGGNGVHIWNLDTNRVNVIGTFDNDAFALTPDETLLAVSNHDKSGILIYNSKSPTTPDYVKPTGIIVNSLRFTKDGKFLLTGTGNSATVSLHNVRTGEPRWSIIGFEKEPVMDAFFNKNETLLFVVRGGGNESWKTETTIIFDVETLLPVCQIPADFPRNTLLSQNEKYLFLPGARHSEIYKIPDIETIKSTVEKLKTLTF